MSEDILMVNGYTKKPFSEMHYYTVLILFRCGCVVWGQSRGVARERKNELYSFLPTLYIPRFSSYHFTLENVGIILSSNIDIPEELSAV